MATLKKSDNQSTEKPADYQWLEDGCALLARYAWSLVVFLGTTLMHLGLAIIHLLRTAWTKWTDYKKAKRETKDPAGQPTQAADTATNSTSHPAA